jgi:hypothetical protein
MCELFTTTTHNLLCIPFLKLGQNRIEVAWIRVPEIFSSAFCTVLISKSQRKTERNIFPPTSFQKKRKCFDLQMHMFCHVRWVPYHQGMARPQVADVRWVPCHQGMARPQVADVRWVPCHHGMARPPVADGGYALHVWRVVANKSNKQSRTAEKG